MTPIQLERLRRRLYSRAPVLGAVIRRSAARKLAGTRALSSVRMLAQALVDNPDAHVRSIGLAFLEQLTRQSHVDAVVSTWVDSRSPALEKVMLERGWVAANPPLARVLSLLKQGQMSVLTKGDGHLIPALVTATEDRDERLAGAARQALLELESPQAREALCDVVIQQDTPAARQAAQAAGYLPAGAYQRALFYFFTEQWECYQEIDFDQSSLRAAYEGGSAELRRRILERLRRAGRIDYLTVLGGADYRSRVALLEAHETDLLLRVLAENREWGKLWSLALDVRPAHTAQIVTWLATNHWAPESGDEAALTRELAGSLPPVEALSVEAMRRVLPPAVRRAEARVPGRINDMVFHPEQSTLAVGTGQGKVVLWDYQRGERVRLHAGLDHSVGRVALWQDVVLCAERGNGATECAIHAWQDGESFQLGNHLGAVTSLEPFGHRLLATGRDGRIVVWNLDRRCVEVEQRMIFWARSARISPHGERVALLHDGVSLLHLPGLEALADVKGAGRRGVVRCATFGPDGKGLVVGRHNGQVVTIGHIEEAPSRVSSRMVHQHFAPVVGVEYLPKHRLILSAAGDDHLNFTPWPEGDGQTVLRIDRVRAGGAALTSLHVTRDGAFLAVGDAGARFSLWDLRVLDVPGLFDKPLARSTPGDLATVDNLLESLSLPAREEAALRFLQRLLRFRFRYEIDLEELPAIRMGEFDIEVE